MPWSKSRGMEPMPEATPKASGLKGLMAPILCAGLIVGGYGFYWATVAETVRGQLQAALRDVPPARITMTGFPYRLTANIQDFARVAESGTQFRAAQLIMTASPFEPQLWVLEAALEPALAFPGGALQPLSATNLKASLRVDDVGLKRLSVTFDGIRPTAGPAWSVGQGAFHLVGDPKDATRYAMSLDINDITLSRSPEGVAALMGQVITRVRLAGPIAQGPSLASSLRAWAQAGGGLQVMAAELAWGPVRLREASGRMNVSRDGHWQGEIAGRGGLEPEGVALQGLSAPVSVRIIDSQVQLLGQTGIRLPKAFD